MSKYLSHSSSGSPHGLSPDEAAIDDAGLDEIAIEGAYHEGVPPEERARRREIRRADRDLARTEKDLEALYRGGGGGGGAPCAMSPGEDSRMRCKEVTALLHRQKGLTVGLLGYREASLAWAEDALAKGIAGVSPEEAALAKLAALSCEAEVAARDLGIDEASIRNMMENIGPPNTTQEAKQIMQQVHQKKEIEAKKKAVKAYEMAESLGGDEALAGLPRLVVSLALNESKGMSLISNTLSTEDRKAWGSKGKREQLVIFYTRKAQYEMIPKIDSVLADDRRGLGGIWQKLHTKYGPLEEDCLDPKWREAYKLASSGQAERARDAVQRLKGTQSKAYWSTAKHMSRIDERTQGGGTLKPGARSFSQVALASHSKASLSSTGWGKTLHATAASNAKVAPE
jgi:hypothetical protein